MPRGLAAGRAEVGAAPLWRAGRTRRDAGAGRCHPGRQCRGHPHLLQATAVIFPTDGKESEKCATACRLSYGPAGP
jgi:hypothetical protein